MDEVEPHDVAVPNEEEEDDSQAVAWPSPHALASTWEESGDVRKVLRDTGKMLKWPKVELCGLGSLSALSANRQAIHDTLLVWCAFNKGSAKSPPIDWLRQEARMLKCAYPSQKKILIDSVFICVYPFCWAGAAALRLDECWAQGLQPLLGFLGDQAVDLPLRQKVESTDFHFPCFLDAISCHESWGSWSVSA